MCIGLLGPVFHLLKDGTGKNYLIGTHCLQLAWAPCPASDAQITST